jgi:histidyl-tRNA synthetase
MDVNLISFMVKFYERIGLKGIKVKINSIGKLEDRIKYMEALREYFKPYIDDLCDDCKARFEKNTLRILDCKEDADKDCIKNAPKIGDYLSDESKEYLNKVLEGLKSLDIEYEIDDTLVRGLDYYNDTVFEVVFNNSSALGGGGRYDKLTSILDGVDLPAVGFAIGVTRVIDILYEEDIQIIDNDGLDAYILPISENENKYAMELMSSLRDNAFKVDMDFTGKKMPAKFKEADRYNAKFVIIVGEDEVKSNKLTVRDNLTKEETKIERDNLIDYLDVNI